MCVKAPMRVKAPMCVEAPGRAEGGPRFIASRPLVLHIIRRIFRNCNELIAKAVQGAISAPFCVLVAIHYSKNEFLQQNRSDRCRN